jgi:hypothetical protein
MFAPPVVWTIDAIEPSWTKLEVLFHLRCDGRKSEAPHAAVPREVHVRTGEEGIGARTPGGSKSIPGPSITPFVPVGVALVTDGAGGASMMMVRPARQGTSLQSRPLSTSCTQRLACDSPAMALPRLDTTWRSAGVYWRGERWSHRRELSPVHGVLGAGAGGRRR